MATQTSEDGWRPRWCSPILDVGNCPVWTPQTAGAISSYQCPHLACTTCCCACCRVVCTSWTAACIPPTFAVAGGRPKTEMRWRQIHPDVAP